ncbi:hypothetical protein CLG96_08535 [Sphingomonas oleivorans]|uniref:SPOR domain-containing protein n=2 Tax=Sphingomonas oleivorans TaxID=1735121 RepID=A0A2T5FYS7_9SPHN|nr:hypothetical protein CLG96_08535 [Sphingomonas oleivorans]
MENPRAALRFFDDAVSYGVPVAEIAADRGLAYDLRGDNKRAQADYALALRQSADPEAIRRLALSQAISGDRVAALATLDPLLRKQDIPAWRVRAFILAITGDVIEAEKAAAAVMPRPQAEALRPYLARIGALKAGQKAAAVHFGHFPVDRKLPTAAQTVTGSPAPVSTGVGAKLVLATAPSDRDEPPSMAIASAATAKSLNHASTRMTLVAEEEKKDKVEPQPAKPAKSAKPAAPERIWVQVAGGANKATLPRAWAALKEKYPKQLAGRTPSTMAYRFTNRLLVGPFKTNAEAQAFVNAGAKAGMSSFAVTSEAGQEVEKLSVK